MPVVGRPYSDRTVSAPVSYVIVAALLTVLCWFPSAFYFDNGDSYLTFPMPPSTWCTGVFPGICFFSSSDELFGALSMKSAFSCSDAYENEIVWQDNR